MAEPRATPPRTRRAGSLPAFDRLAPPPAEADVRQWIGGRSAASDVVVELHGRGGWVTRAAAEEPDPLSLIELGMARRGVFDTIRKLDERAQRRAQTPV